MDIRERYFDQEEQSRVLLDSLQARMWTALRVIVEEYDEKTQTVKLKAAHKVIQRSPEGKMEAVELPLFQDVPVNFPSGGGVTITLPLKKGDEGEIQFMSRSLDTWHQQGGTQTPIDMTMHSLSHGTFHPAGRSQPRKLKNVSKDSVQIRSDDDDAKHVIDIHPKDGLTLKSWEHQVQFREGKMTFKSDKHIDFQSEKLSHNGHNISATHKHSGVQPGSGFTAEPDAEA